MATGGAYSNNYFGTCKYPGCTRPRYRESYGYTHDFCGRTHAQLYRSLSPPSNTYTTGTANFATGKADSSKFLSTSSRKPLKATYSLTGSKQDFGQEIKFYNRDEPCYEFTNFYPATVSIDGQKWPTTEHYFQAQKFIGTPYVEMIRKLQAPRQAFQMSRDPKVSRWRRSDWEAVKDDIMYKAVRCKFDQHEHLRKKLLGTGNKKLIEHTTNDSYWGDGGGHGLNKLGGILMKVRNEMQEKYGPYKSKSDSYSVFDQFSSTLAYEEASRSVRGLASPMTSRKTSPLKRSSSFHGGLTTTTVSSKQSTLAKVLRDDTSITSHTYQSSKPTSHSGHTSFHSNSSQWCSTPKDDSHLNQSQPRTLRKTIRRSNSVSDVSARHGASSNKGMSPIQYGTSKPKKNFMGTLKETFQNSFSKPKKSPSSSNATKRSNYSSVPYNIITNEPKPHNTRV